MAGIFYFSSRPDPLDFLPPSRYVSSVDKFAHASEYAVLAFLLYRALKGRGSGGTEEQGGGEAKEQRGEIDSSSAPLRLSTPALIAFAYAVLDELHQELVPGRGLQLADIGYDLAGIMATLGLIWVRER